MSTHFRNMIVATVDLTPLVTGQALETISLLVVCGPVKALDKILDEVAVEPISEARLAINQSFDILVWEYNHVSNESAEGGALGGKFVDFVNGRGAREGKLIVEQADDLVDCNVLDARDGQDEPGCSETSWHRRRWEW
jgi:hypothetical protein